MTDEQINAAIAEACGWKTECTICDSPDCPTDPMPDYCADLNAMHEAEKMLTGSLKSGYGYELWDVVGSKTLGAFENINATARQRAEAFLRTLGKWEEGE